MFKCPFDNRQFQSRQALADHKRDAHAGGQRANRRRNVPARNVPAAMATAVGTQGDVVTTISRMEKLVTLNGSVGLVVVSPLQPHTRTAAPTTAVLPWLARLYGVFSKVEWISAELHYRPTCGTNTSGAITYTMDWSGLKPNTRDKVLACAPLQDHAVWQASTLVLPRDKLQSRKSYDTSTEVSYNADTCPGNFAVALSSNQNVDVGELWVKYTVKLFGPHG